MDGARELLAQRVEEKKKELLSRNSAMTPLEAHRKAIDLAIKESPALVECYRLDAK